MTNQTPHQDGVNANAHLLARTQRRFSTGLVSVLLAATCALSTPAAWAQNTGTSMPSIPDHFQESGLSRTKGYENQAVNEVIDTFTGKLQYHFTDLVIPGTGGMDLAVQRSYNSIDDPHLTYADFVTDELKPLGVGWTMHMGRVMRSATVGVCNLVGVNTGANPVLETPDGGRHVLYESQVAGVGWITKSFWRARCVGGYLHVQSPDGTTYEMTVAGHSFGPVDGTQNTYYAGRIADRNGNWFSLSYAFLPNGIQAIREITTSDGRSVSFAYNGSFLSTITDNGSNRVWQYTVGNGPAAGLGHLTEVRRPDGLSWNYAYHTASPGLGSMRRIEYPSGGSIDYTYGHVNFRAGYLNNALSTVISSKEVRTNTADGILNAQVGTWSWSYDVASALMNNRIEDNSVIYMYNMPPAPENRNQYNITRVTDPLQQEVEHFYMGLVSVDASPKLTGTYLGRTGAGTDGLEEVELFSYADIGISTQPEIHVSRFALPPESSVFATVRRYHYRGRAGQSHRVTSSNFDTWGNAGTTTEVGAVGTTRTHTRTTSITYAPATESWLLRLATGMTVTVAAEGAQPAETYSIANVYDTNGNLTSQTKAGVATTYSYTPQGDLASTTDALGRSTTYTSHFRGIARQESQPEGVNLSRVVNGAGNVVSQTNGRGLTTTYAFDELNRVTQINPPLGAPVSVVYGARNRTVTRGAMVDELTMDGLGRPQRRSVSGGGLASISVNFGHDILGRRMFTSYPNQTTGIGHAFDSLGRPIQTYHNASPDLTTHDALETTSYQSMNVLHTDANGAVRFVQHRSFGDPQEQQIIDSIQGTAQGGQIFPILRTYMRRNAMGQATRIEMGGVAREWTYDSRYYLVSSSEPETGLTVYGRDAVGNMTTRSVGGLPAVTYTYDGRNRLRQVSYPESENSQVPNAPDVVTTYDANDQVLSVVAGPVSRSYTYDDNDKLIAEALELDGRTYNLAYAYDANEALASMTYPSGRTVDFQPDAFGRARAAAPYVTSVDYHPNGMPEEVSYANGVRSNIGLNARQWPESLSVVRAGGALVNSSFGYDPMGQMTSITDSVDSAFNREFQYDTANRVRSEIIGGVNTGYVYNNRGDLTSMGFGNGVLTSHFYDGSTRRLLTVDRSDGVFRTYDYDTVGNVVADGLNQFGYDRADQMRCVGCGTGSETRYGYDGTSMRVKTEAAGQTSYALYSQTGLLMMTETPGVERREYIYLGRRQVAEHRVRLD